MILDYDKENTIPVWVISDVNELGESLEPSTLIIMLFNSLPTRSDILNENNTLFSVSSPILNETSGAYEFTTPIIPDPIPSTDTQRSDPYYLGVKYSYDNINYNCSIQTVFYKRLKTYLDSLTVNADMIKKLDKSVVYHFGESSPTLDFISNAAKSELLTSFKKKGIDISQIRNVSDLQIPITYLALKIAFTTEIRNSGDGASEKADRYAVLASQSIENIVLQFGNEDSSGGDPKTSNIPLSIGSIRSIF